jgi:iron complex outermembrane receptor protein
MRPITPSPTASSLDGGLRYTWESRSEYYNGTLTSNTGNLNAAQIADMSSAAANAAMGSVNQSLKDNSLSGEGTISYKVQPDVMLYAKFARGYKSAGSTCCPSPIRAFWRWAAARR